MLPFFASQALCFSNFFFLPFFLLLSPTTQSQQLLKTIQALFIYPEIQNGSLGSQICRHGQAEAPWSRALLPGAPGQTAQGQGATRSPCTGPQTSLFPSPFLRTRRNKQETALHGSLCVHNLNAASPNTLPLFPSHVGASKTSTKKGKRAGRLLVTKAEKQTATSVL